MQKILTKFQTCFYFWCQIRIHFNYHLLHTITNPLSHISSKINENSKSYLITLLPSSITSKHSTNPQELF